MPSSHLHPSSFRSEAGKEGEAVLCPPQGLSLDPGTRREQLLPAASQGLLFGQDRHISGYPRREPQPGEEVQSGTYPSPTTTHLMACIVSGTWEAALVTAQGTEGFCGLQGLGEPGKAPRQRSSHSRTGGRRKRKWNLPKLLPQQPFAEGGACGLAEQLGAPQVLGWGTRGRPGYPLGWGVSSCPWGQARAVLQRLQASRNSMDLNSKC